MITENAELMFRERYYLRNSQGDVIETAPQLWWRVANHIASVEEESVRQYWAQKFHDIMKDLDFLPNTPTLMNAGKDNGQLSACYVLPIEDSMVGIFTTLKNAAIIHQTGGGTGFDFSRLRPEGSMVSNKSGVSTGPLAFCQVYDKATDVIKQGASRRGANMMNLRIDHPDILDFIDMKMTPGVMTNFNVSVTITDEFMEALENDKEYELTHPFTGSVTSLSARDVWNKIAANAWRSAEPGIIFIDRVNKFSPYSERIEATNPCGEQPLPPYGSCNLGSINLSNFVENNEINLDRLADVITTSVRFLDNVIDANVYPLAELTAHAKRYRNIGLGVMGWADMLLWLGIPYDSDHAVDLGRDLMQFINEVAHKVSIDLGKEKGLPEGAPFKTFFDYSSENRRNATLTTIAPTGSLCIGTDCSPSIEPNYEFDPYEKHVLNRKLVVVHSIAEQAKKEGWYTKELFRTAYDVSPYYHVKHQAAFQENCDSGISKTINLPESATEQDVRFAYLWAWKFNCKGITVYRNGSREGVLHKIETEEDDSFTCCESPNIVNEAGCEICKNCNWSKCLIA